MPAGFGADYVPMAQSLSYRAGFNRAKKAYEEPGWPGGRLANQSMRQAYRTLYGILQQQGATDPRLFNQQLMGIQRGTEAQQQDFQQQLAAQGLGGSGVGQASYAAIGQAGENRLAQARAAEAALQEERKRQDIQMIIDLILNPRLAYRGQNSGLLQQQLQNQAASRAANAQAIAGLLGMFGTVAGGWGGGAGAGSGYGSMGHPYGAV